MTRIAFDPPDSSRPPTSIAGGVASGGEIFAQAIDTQALVDNTNSAHMALSTAYDARSRAVKAATGVDLGNPIAPFAGMVGSDFGELSTMMERRRADYQARLDQLAGQFPDKADIIKSTTPIERDAEELARQSDERLARLMASNPNWSSGVAAFLGGAVGAFRDPVTVGSLALGGGPGAARTVAGRIFMTAATEALVNAGVTGAMQPAVQDWRKRAGLPNGFDEAARNVLFAAALGGAFGAGGRGLAETVPKVFRRVAETLQPVKEVLPAEQRGALAAAEQIAATDAQRPAAVAPDRFDATVSQADAAAHRIEAPPAEPDPVTVNRIVNALAPAPDSISAPPAARSDKSLTALAQSLINPPTATLRAPTPLLDFLRRLGGVDPSAPIAAELKAAGVDARSVYRKGGLKALDNLPHDELPAAIRHEIAPDGNGYADQQALIDLAGREAGAPQAGRTVDDLSAERAFYEEQGVDFTRPIEEVKAALAQVDAAHGRYDAPSDEAVSVPDGLTRRQHTAELVRAVLRAQPGLPEPLVHEAVNLSLFEHLPIDQALEDTLATHGRAPAAAAPDTPLGRQLEAVPDTVPELVPDIAPPDDGGLAAERAALEAMGFTGDVPFGDASMSLANLDKHLKETAWLERVVEACKV